MDRCGKVEWATTDITHHSPHWTADGGIVVSGGRYVEGGDIPWPFEGPYWEDLVFKYDAEGNKVASGRVEVAAQ